MSTVPTTRQEIALAIDRIGRISGGFGGSRRALPEEPIRNQGSSVDRGKGELYPQVRRWYAKDRGRAILREVMRAGRLPEPSSA